MPTSILHAHIADYVYNYSVQIANHDYYVYSYNQKTMATHGFTYDSNKNINCIATSTSLTFTHYTTTMHIIHT